MYDVGGRVDVLVFIDLPIFAVFCVIVHPIDFEFVAAVLLRNRQAVFYLLFGDGVLKRQQNVRRFVCVGADRNFS